MNESAATDPGRPQRSLGEGHARPASGSRWTAAADVCALVLCALPLGRFLWVALHRFSYPYDLEWTEGGLLLQASRLVAGHPLYAAPSLDFVSFMYPPGYHALVATLIRIFGDGYSVPRLASIAATIGTGALIAWLALAAGNRLSIALAWAGVWFGTYRLSGFFFDLVRVDSLLTLLLVAAAAAWLHDQRRRSGASLLWLVLVAAAAVMVKQAALPFCAALVLAIGLAAGWRRSIAFLGLLAGVLAVAVAALQVTSHGWFWFYAVAVPARHGFAWQKLQGSLLAQGIGGLPVAWLFLPGLAAAAREAPVGRGPRSAACREWLGVAALVGAAVLSGIGMAAHLWSFRNVYMPTHAFLVLGAAWTTPPLLRALGAKAHPPVWLLAGLALQLSVSWFDAAAQVPGPTARMRNDRIVERLARVEGRVLAPEFPYLLEMAHRDPCFHLSALSDLEYARGAGLAVDLRPLASQALREQSAYLAGDYGVPSPLAPVFAGAAAEQIAAPNPQGPPLAGVHNQPLKLLLRRPARAAR